MRGSLVGIDPTSALKEMQRVVKEVKTCPSVISPIVPVRVVIFIVDPLLADADVVLPPHFIFSQRRLPPPSYSMRSLFDATPARRVECGRQANVFS